MGEFGFRIRIGRRNCGTLNPAFPGNPIDCLILRLFDTTPHLHKFRGDLRLATSKATFNQYEGCHKFGGALQARKFIARFSMIAVKAPSFLRPSLWTMHPGNFPRWNESILMAVTRKLLKRTGEFRLLPVTLGCSGR